MNEIAPGFRTAKLEPHQCPACGYAMDAATNAEPGVDITPSPGSASICFRCGALAIYTDELQLRAPAAEELADIKRSPQWPIIERIQAARRAVRAQYDALPDVGKRIADDVQRQWGWMDGPKPPLIFKRQFISKAKRQRRKNE